MFDLCIPRLWALSRSRSPEILWLAYSSLAMWISTAGAASKKQPERFFEACNFLFVYNAASQHQTGTPAASHGEQRRNLPMTHRRNNASVGSQLFENLTRIIWESWEHPVPEIRSLTKTMFSDLLTLLESQSSWASKVGPQRVEELSGDSYADIPKTGFCELLAQRLTRSQWYVKGRYALLCTVATRLGFEKMLSLSPSLIEECIKCLQINNLAPQGIRLISELSKAARKEWKIELFGKYKGPLTSGGKSSSSSSKSKANLAELEVREIAIAAKWSTVWKDMMLSALAGDDQHTRGQVAVYWLPETMKLFPAALNSIVTEYTALLGYGADGSPVEGFVDTSTAEVRSRRLGALMVAIKSARGAGLLSNNSLHGGPTLSQSEEYDDDCSDVSSDEDDDDDNINVGGSCEAKSGDEPKSKITSTLMAIAVPYALVHEALCHSDRQIQMDGLAFVCCDLRTTAELTTSELTLLREFIPRNMNYGIFNQKALRCINPH